jgi:hypothetical protein
MKRSLLAALLLGMMTCGFVGCEPAAETTPPPAAPEASAPAPAPAPDAAPPVEAPK